MPLNIILPQGSGQTHFAMAYNSRDMNRRSFLNATLAFPSLLAAQTNEKRLLVHADDAGMCHSVNEATIEALTKGMVSSASIMVPCPWFPEFAAWAKQHPEMDLGLHLTLTSEWQHYRWRPVAPASSVKGLFDPEGYMWRSEVQTAKSASAQEVETELRAQIERAREFGVAFTHFDTHMGTMYTRPDYFDVYAKLAREYKVPCMIPRPSEELRDRKTPITEEMILAQERGGAVLLDHLVTGISGRTPAERRESYIKLLEGLPAGVTKLIIHLAKDTPEIRAVTGAWEYRWEDFLFWTDPATKQLMDRLNIRLITYRELGRRG